MGVKKAAYTSKEIDRLLEQGGKFLRAISRHAMIREILQSVGYTNEEHQRGIGLFSALMGFGAEKKGVETPQNKAFQALSQLDAWDEPNFAKAKAALKARFPEQEEYLFKGLEAKKGVGAIWSVGTYLERLEAMRSGSEAKRKGQKKADQEAVLYLETRRLAGKEIEERLRGWLAEAKNFDAGSVAPAEDAKLSKKEAKKAKAAAEAEDSEGGALEADDENPQIQSDAEAFDLWLRDWKTTARIEIKRREYRIALGLTARRKGKKGKDDVEEEDEPEEPTTQGE